MDDLTALVAERILKRIAAKYDYIDITGYIGDGVGRYDDETWEQLARVAAEAAVEVIYGTQQIDA